MQKIYTKIKVTNLHANNCRYVTYKFKQMEIQQLHHTQCTIG